MSTGHSDTQVAADRDDGPGPGAGSPLRRPEVKILLASLLVLVLAAGLVVWTVLRDPGESSPPSSSPSPATSWEPASEEELLDAEDAIHRRSLAELKLFTDWLEENDAEGYIGEVGIPGGQDGDRWLLVAQRWFEAAAEADLPVDVWSVGEWWEDDYTYTPYVSDGDALEITWPQGEFLTWVAENTDLPRGVNLSGGEFGAAGGNDMTSDFSNENPGEYDREWHYDSQESLDYLAAAGMDTLRVPFRWERVQPELGGELDPEEVGRLRDLVGRADAAGLEVTLDLHNFAAYLLGDGEEGVRTNIGSDQLSIEQYADVWRRLSEAFSDVPGVKAYDLMNEPVNLEPVDGLTPPEVWERASQAAVTAIRETGDDTLIMVPGYEWSHAFEFPAQHPDGWIEDPADNFRYAAHQYWSYDRGVSYDDDLADAVDDGY
jgi:hypothetical protein